MLSIDKNGNIARKQVGAVTEDQRKVEIDKLLKSGRDLKINQTCKGGCTGN